MVPLIVDSLIRLSQASRQSAAEPTPVKASSFGRGRASCCVECDAQFALRLVTPSPKRPRPSSAIVLGSGTAVCRIVSEKKEQPPAGQ